MRLIDADALPISVAWMEQGSKQEHCAFVFERDIKDAPTVDAVEVKHGHWINERLVTTDDGRIYGIATCSVCKGSYVYVLDVWNYCPNCGANMDEVTE